KMGISTIQSYLGAQVFEILGIDRTVVKKYFTRTPTRIGGIGIEEIAGESLKRHELAFFPGINGGPLEIGGNYHWRQTGEFHQFNPESIHLLQRACRSGDYDMFKRYSSLIADQTREQGTLRGLMKFRENSQAIPISEVEPV